MKSSVERCIDAAKQIDKSFSGPEQFVHLHNHTIFSTLDGIAKPAEYFDVCSALGHKAFAITDHGNLGAIPDAYTASQSSGIKLIVGCEVYYNEYHPEMVGRQKEGQKWSDFTPDEQEKYRRNRHITVLAKNDVGFRNLIALTNTASDIGFYYKPRVWPDLIDKYKEGLIILSGCINGPCCHQLVLAMKADNDQDRQLHLNEGLKKISVFREMLGEDFFIEVQVPGQKVPNSLEVFGQMVAISNAIKLPMVMTNDCHIISREDFEVQRCMMAIEQNTTIDDPDLFMLDSDDLFFKSRAQLRQTFVTHGYNKLATTNDFETSCDNSIMIADRCEPFTPNVDPKLPKVHDADNLLARIVAEQLVQRNLLSDRKFKIDGIEVTYEQQAAIEIERICEKGFASYFLITRDLVQFARSNKWDVGPGRGSAGGSLVCYLLGVHDLDPLKWGLSFDRFLSVTRGGYSLNCTME